MKIIIIAACLLALTTLKAQDFEWAKSFGGAGYDRGYSITTDLSGNVYTTGCFKETVDFDPGAGTNALISAGGIDIFVQKMDASGNFLWAKSFGGTGDDLGISICIDDFGNVYTTGLFYGIVDFDPGAGTTTLISQGLYDIFVQKMDASGNFLWAKSFGSPYWDEGSSICTDASGNVYTTGTFRDTLDFDPGPGTNVLISAGGIDIFVQKMDASGNFIWAKSFGGTSGDGSNSITLDASGNVYTTGSFFGTVDFDPGVGTFILTTADEHERDIFVQKMDASGNFIWAKSFGGTDDDMGSSISADASGNIYTTGSFRDTVDFDPGPGTNVLISAGGIDIFVQKMDASGNFIWAKSFGGPNQDCGYSINIDAFGNVYTTGYFWGTVDFNPGAGTTTLISEGLYDIFVQKMDASGNFLWAKSFGGSSNAFSNYISVDATGNVYTTGIFEETVDFDPGAGINLLTSEGGMDVFVQKLSQQNFGIIENNFGEELNVFPNPTTGDLSLDLGYAYKTIRIIITSITGKLIYSKTVTQTQMVNLSVEGPAGVYFITVNSGDKKAVIKLLKE